MYRGLSVVCIGKEKYMNNEHFKVQTAMKVKYLL